MMKTYWTRSGHVVMLAALWFGGVVAGRSQQMVTYNDHVLPLIEQHCANCHNPDKKKGDLILTSYNALLKGGGSGAVVVSGNVDGSKMWKAITHAEDPTMPPNKPKLADKDLDVFRNWIAGGLLETSGSKAVTAIKPAIDLTMKISGAGKPQGPPPMPHELSMEPITHTKRAAPIVGLAASPWAPIVALAGQKQILIYNVTNLDLLGILPFTEGQPWDLRFSRSGKLLIAAGGHGAKSGRVILWNIESGERVTTVGKEYDTVLAADISPDQSLVALGGPSRLVKIHSTKTGEVEHKMKKHTDWVTAVAFSPNGEFLASADRNGGVVIWDAENGQELFTTAGHKAAVTALSWRDDSRLVASSSEDGSVKLWETGEGKLAKTWVAHATGVLGVAYGHDGKFVTCGRDGTVMTWSGEGSRLKNCEFAGEPVLRAVLTDDNSRVVAADFAGHVGVWRALDGKKLGELDANPPPLSEQIALVQKKLEALQAQENKPVAANPATNVAGPSGGTSESAQASLEKARANFAAKAQEVARLKQLAAAGNPPADLEQKLTEARAARERARVATNAATLALQGNPKSASEVKRAAPTADPAPDPAAELAATRALLARLTRAQVQAERFRARENVAAKQRELDAGKTALLAQQDEQKKLQRELGAARNAAERTRLKAAIKASTAAIQEAE
ncbi:MAG: hypothetical protein QOF48_2409, partial [Verrucomicrobiota bacterium]